MVRLRLPGAAVSITSLLLALPAPAPARELSRRMIVPLALQNPQIAAAQAQVAQAEARGAQASAARWPRISLEAGAGPSLQAELVPGTAVQSTQKAYSDISITDLSVVVGGRLDIVQPLYTFGKIGKRRQAAAEEVKARLAQLDISKVDVAVSSAELYEGYLFARDALRFFEEALRIVDRATTDTQKQLDRNNPDFNERDLLELQAGRAAVLLGINEATARRAQALAGLRAYLGLPVSEEITVEEEELDPLAVELSEPERLVATALEQRPELMALEHGSAAYAALAEARLAGFWPDLVALGFVSAAYTPGRDLVDTRYYADPLYHFVPGLLVGLRWTVWGPMAAAEAAEEQARARQLDALRRWAVEGVPADVRKEYFEAQRARADIESARSGTEHAKEWLVRTTADYAIGFADTDNLTDAVEAYTRLRLAYFDAVYRRNTALVRLARATGTLLTRGVGPYGGKQ